MLFAALLTASLSLTVTDSTLSPEAALFLEGLPKTFTAQQITAIDNAIGGDSTDLDSIRARRVTDPLRLKNSPGSLKIPYAEWVPDSSIQRDSSAVIFYFHGGGWVLGSAASAGKISQTLANRTGLTVITPEYRLAPEYPYPIPLIDCIETVHQLRGTRKIFLAGDSAGGNLAAAVTLQLIRQKERLPEGVILFYPALDLADRSYDTIKRYETGYCLDECWTMRFITAYVRDPSHRTDPRVSPIYANLKNFPPCILIAAEHDILRGEGKRFADKLKFAKREVTYTIIPGAIHIFITVRGMPKAFNQAVNLATDFIQKQMAK